MWKEFKHFLKTWKPIHLCWLFEKYGLPIPKYFIGGAATIPSVTTVGSDNVTGDGARMLGNVTSDGGASITERGFFYSKTSVNNNPSRGGTGVTTVTTSGTTGEYNITVSSLDRDTQYSFRAFATNSKGDGEGEVDTFTTLNTPTVRTDAVDNIGSTSARGNGEIENVGVANCTERGFVYSKTSRGDPGNTSPDDSDYEYVENETGTYTAEAFSLDITGLDSLTTYYVRAYAKNSDGYAYGSQVSFQTLAALPTVSTYAVSDITTVSIEGNGEITNTGGVACTERGFVYSKTSRGDPGNTSPAASDYEDVENETGTYTAEAFSLDITGLDSGTTYYVRAYAKNSTGYAYGDEVSFQAEEVGPTRISRLRLDIAHKQIKNLEDPVDAQDGLNKQYSDQHYTKPQAGGKNIWAQETAPVSGEKTDDLWVKTPAELQTEQYIAVTHETAPYFALLHHTNGSLSLAASYTLAGNGMGASFSPDGQYIAVAYWNVPYFTLLHLTNGSLSLAAVYNVGQASYCASFSPDGQYIGIGRWGNPGFTLLHHTNGTLSLAATYNMGGAGQEVSFSPDCQYIAVAHWDSPYFTLLHHTNGTLSLAAVYTLPGTGQGTSFSPDCQYIAVAHSTTPYFTLLHHTNGSLSLAAVYTRSSSCTSFSPDGQYIGMGQFTLLHHTNGSLSLAATYNMAGAGQIEVSFSPDCQYIAVVSYYGAPYFRLLHHTNGSLSLAAVYTLAGYGRGTSVFGFWTQL